MYNITPTNWDIIESSTDTPNVLFTRLATINFYYSLFEKLVKSLFSLLIFNTPENPIIDIY